MSGLHMHLQSVSSSSSSHLGAPVVLRGEFPDHILPNGPTPPSASVHGTNNMDTSSPPILTYSSNNSTPMRHPSSSSCPPPDSSSISSIRSDPVTPKKKPRLVFDGVEIISPRPIRFTGTFPLAGPPTPSLSSQAQNLPAQLEAPNITFKTRNQGPDVRISQQKALDMLKVYDLVAGIPHGEQHLEETDHELAMWGNLQYLSRESSRKPQGIPRDPVTGIRHVAQAKTRSQVYLGLSRTFFPPVEAMDSAENTDEQGAETSTAAGQSTFVSTGGPRQQH